MSPDILNILHMLAIPERVLKGTATQHSTAQQQHLGKEGLRRCISTGSDERQQWRLVAERGQASGLHDLSNL
jgi:hypothetical protein